MKFNYFNKRRNKIKQLLESEDTEIVENSKYNENKLQKELKKIVKANEELTQDKPIDTSILIRKIEKKPDIKPAPDAEHSALEVKGSGIKEKKFKCDCGSEFVYKHDLKRHQWGSNKHIKWVHDNKK